MEITYNYSPGSGSKNIKRALVWSERDAQQLWDNKFTVLFVYLYSVTVTNFLRALKYNVSLKLATTYMHIMTAFCVNIVVAYHNFARKIFKFL